MRFRFKRNKEHELYSKGKGKEKYPLAVFKAFRRRIELIKASKDERDLRAMKGIRFEKLETRKDIHAMKLDKQFRLEISFEKTDSGEKRVCIEKISKHYGD